MASHIEIMVEELSMEAALRLIVPKIAGSLSFEVYPYQCKQDLLDKLAERLQGCAKWLPDDWRVVVVVDRDDDHCSQLKNRLEDSAKEAGLRTRSQHHGSHSQVLNRLAIEELEAWFFGDWDAVKAAYPKVNPNVPAKQGYRDPDANRRRRLGGVGAHPEEGRILPYRRRKNRSRQDHRSEHGSGPQPFP